MIHLVFSNHTERLLSLLAGDLADFRMRRGPWEAAHLVLPNPGVRQFVESGLALSELKVVANLRMNYLEGFWRRFLPEGVKLLDRASLHGLLLGLLQEQDFLARPELGPVRAYLEGEPRGLKALQFSGAMARLFEAYLLGRPQWALGWREGLDVAQRAPAGLEAWQRSLWKGLQDRLAVLPERWLSLPEFFADPLFDEVVFPEEIFLFGPGPMALAYHRAFHRLGQRSEAFNVHLYVHNPCQEEWSELRRDWGGGQGEDPLALDTRAPLALQRWGKPGREHVCQLCELVDWNLDMEGVESEGRGLLQALQDEILTLAPTDRLEADDTLRILACTSPRREAEAVADEIWETLRRHEGAIRFSDVAVVLPEGIKADYLDALRGAFSGAHEIPWRLADEGPQRVKELVEGSLLLLRLAFGDLNRAEILRALGHPAFRRRWPELALDELPDFCERAGIVARLDAAETEGTYLEGGLWTWERGLQRAALGAFLGEGALPLGEHGLPSAPLPEGAADLALLLRALLGDLRRLRSLHQTPAAWCAAFRSLLQAYLGQPEGRGEESEHRALAELGKALERLEALELPGIEAPAIGGREALALAEEAFQGLTQEALGPYGKGVVVASHAALRGVPFKAVFCLGMGEGVFPGGDIKDPLDLKSFRRLPGDVSRSEQDRYLFLETLGSARERLVLSYTCRDPLSGEELQPSPLILDLRDILRPSLGEEGWKALWVHPPLHRHDPEHPALHTPEARAEAEALRLGQALRARAGRPELPEDPRRWGLSAPSLEALQERLHFCGPLGTAGRDHGDRILVRAGDLRKWLECQIQGGAKLRLGLRGEAEGDPADLAEEPFEADFLAQRGLVRELFWESLQGDLDLEQAYEARVWGLREAVKAPAGFLGEGDRRKALTLIEGWRSLLAPGTEPQVHRFGSDRSRGTLAAEAHPAISWPLELGGRTVTLVLEGQTEPQWAEGSLLLSERKAPGKKGPEVKDRRELLRAWFDQLLMAAAGLKVGPHRARVLASAEENRAWHADLPELDQAGARERLGAWVREALLEPRWTLMPIEGVLEESAKEEGDLEDWVEKQQGSDPASFSSLHGPLKGLLEVEVEPDWKALAQARYGDFLAWSNSWGGGL